METAEVIRTASFKVEEEVIAKITGSRDKASYTKDIDQAPRGSSGADRCTDVMRGLEMDTEDGRSDRDPRVITAKSNLNLELSLSYRA